MNRKLKKLLALAVKASTQFSEITHTGVISIEFCKHRLPTASMHLSSALFMKETDIKRVELKLSGIYNLPWRATVNHMGVEVFCLLTDGEKENFYGQ